MDMSREIFQSHWKREMQRKRVMLQFCTKHLQFQQMSYDNL